MSSPDRSANGDSGTAASLDRSAGRRTAAEEAGRAPRRLGQPAGALPLATGANRRRTREVGAGAVEVLGERVDRRWAGRVAIRLVRADRSPADSVAGVPNQAERQLRSQLPRARASDADRRADPAVPDREAVAHLSYERSIRGNVEIQAPQLCSTTPQLEGEAVRGNAASLHDRTRLPRLVGLETEHEEPFLAPPRWASTDPGRRRSEVQRSGRVARIPDRPSGNGGTSRSARREQPSDQ